MNTAAVHGPGEPNKLCDLIAAAISEEYQKRDPEAETDLHVSGGSGAVFVTGRVKSVADFDVAMLVKQVTGQVDPGLSLEPFIAIETAGALRRPAMQTLGYAVSGRPSFLPSCVDQAMGIARMLEDARRGNEGWFWLSPDFDVTVSEEAGRRLAVVRASHIDSVTIDDVRGQINELICDHADDIRVNPAGADTGNGLHRGTGASGFASGEWYGAKIPGGVNGAGSELSHPGNIGWMIARHLAKRLVGSGAGKAVAADLFWLPLEDEPAKVRVVNERGEDLSGLVDKTKLSRRRLAEKWGAARLVSGALRFPYDGAIDLPFENEDLLQ